MTTKSNHKKKSQIYSFLTIAVLLLSFGLMPMKSGAQFGGGGGKAFGGRISVSPSIKVTEKKQTCESGGTCGGAINIWIDMSKASCSHGTFDLIPSYPKSAPKQGYCGGPEAQKKHGQIAVSKWILGFYQEPTSTQIGMCICITPPYRYETKDVSVDLAHLSLFGTN